MIKKILAICAAALAICACSAPYNQTRAFDEAHFLQLQERIDNPTTPKDVKYAFTEATELNLIGKGVPTANPYARIDTTMYKGFTRSENQQCRCSAGLAVLFTTNSSTISVKTQWGQLYHPVNTMGVAVRGYDLYIKGDDGEWVWAASGATRPDRNPEGNLVLVKNMAPGEKECLLYLPNFCEVYSCKVGVEEGASLKALESPFRHSIVFHGSSYTQGISTSRPGMAYPLQFSRHTGLGVIPLGMSGNCKMQPYYCDVICDIEADAYVFDAFSNPDWKMIRERLQPFIDRLIEAHPGKPIVFQQTIYRESRNFNTSTDAFEQAKQDIASSLFHELLKDPKYKDVYFIQTNACEPGSHEYSVDGIHPDDHGYYLWSRSIEKPLLKIFRKYGIR